MRLIQKSNRSFLVILIVILPLACTVIFLSIRYYIQGEVEEKLAVDELRIVQQLEADKPVNSIAPLIEIEVAPDRELMHSQFNDVMVYDPLEKENEQYREIESVKEINGTRYAIKVRHAMLETNDLVLVIVTVIGIVFLLSAILLYYLNSISSLKLWKPFYTNIDRLRKYSFTNQEELIIEDSSIQEFQELKGALVQLTGRLHSDYNMLKQFTENASHEIQTPLSIISLNLEEALQHELPDEIHQKIYTTYQAVQRLAKLNEKLLLLSKLENHQFNDKKELDLCNILEEKVTELSPLIDQKEVQIEWKSNETFNVNIDPYLANVLMTNLLSNAIKHNIKGGKIELTVTNSSIVISNEFSEKVNTTEIFHRFKKGDSASNSTGLGLALVEQIINGIELTIEASQNAHFFTMRILRK